MKLKSKLLELIVEILEYWIEQGVLNFRSFYYLIRELAHKIIAK